MSKWELKKIEDFGNVYGGGTPSTKDDSLWNGDIPWISPKDLSGYEFKYISNGERFITKEGLEKSSTRLLPKNTILFTSRAPIGYVAIAENPICTNQGFQSVVCKDGISEPEFIYYLLKNNVHIFYNNASGATFPEISNKKVKQIELLLPPFSTQKRIASILSNYDDLIENNLKRIKLLEETAQNIYKEWFVNFRFPNYENTPFNEETGLPVGWEMKKLSELVYLTMGQSPESEYYNINNEGLPFHQGVTGYGHRFVNHSIYCSKITRIAEEGDILFSVRAPVGRLNIAPDKLIIGRGLSAIKNKEGYQSFQFYQLKNHFFQEDMIGGGAIFNSVTKSDLENQLLIYPMNNLIVNFEKIVKPIDGQIWKLNIQNQKLKEARDILLPRLMNRTIEV